MAGWWDRSSEAPEQPRAQLLTCAECGTTSGLRAAGWGGFRVDEPGEPPELAFFCPACLERESLGGR